MLKFAKNRRVAREPNLYILLLLHDVHDRKLRVQERYQAGGGRGFVLLPSWSTPFPKVTRPCAVQFCQASWVFAYRDPKTLSTSLHLVQ